MDYDKTTIALAYDAARGYSPKVLKQWLDLIAASVPTHPAMIVDLGCGTGRFTYPLAVRFQARVIGFDPSEKMLAAARQKIDNDLVEFRQAAAERVPLESGCADIIFMSMVLHHLKDPALVASECHRVIREGGRICVRNSTRDSTYPQQRFFPGITSLIENELPSRSEVIAMFEDGGLRLISHQRVAHFLAANWRDLADKLAMRADSFLARLTDAEFEAGMAALRCYARDSDPHEAIMDDIDFFVFAK
jgi:SAM-dependent methyltransferase